MSNKVLVTYTYATRYGSTREVAEMIAATLREEGSIVDVQSAAEVRDPDGYRWRSSCSAVNSIRHG